MKANDPLLKLFKAAAQAEAAPLPTEMPFGLQTRILANRRSSPDLFSFLPLFRGALACATLVAIVCAGFHFQGMETPDAYEQTLNYSLATAYLE